MKHGLGGRGPSSLAEEDQDRENVQPQVRMPCDQSAKKTKRNKAKKARRRANQALREANQEYLRRVFVSAKDTDCDQAVQDAIDIIQEEGALEEPALRRLSAEKFTSDTLRRLSAYKLEPLVCTEDVQFDNDKIDVVDALRNYVALMDIVDGAVSDQYEPSEAVPAQPPVDLSDDIVDGAVSDQYEPSEAVPAQPPVDLSDDIVDGAVSDQYEPSEAVPAQPPVDLSYERSSQKSHDPYRRRELVNEVYQEAQIVETEGEGKRSLSREAFQESLSKSSLSISVQDRTFTSTHVEYSIEVMVSSSNHFLRINIC